MSRQKMEVIGFKFAEVERRHNEDFTAALYRNDDGQFFVQLNEYQEPASGLEFYFQYGWRLTLPVTACEALQWLGQNADKPIKIYPTEAPGPLVTSSTESLRKAMGHVLQKNDATRSAVDGINGPIPHRREPPEEDVLI